jgi:membrane dipeptidase
LKEYFPLSQSENERAEDLHSKAIVIDASTIVNYRGCTLSKLKLAGITASNHTVTAVDSNFDRGMREIAGCLNWIRTNTDAILIETAGDIKKAKANHAFGLIMGPQNSDLMEGNFDLLAALKKVGVRIMQLTYQTRNHVGDGCLERTDAGLSSFGVKLVQLMNDIGMVVDLSHCGSRTTDEAIEVSKEPVIFSHTHPYTLAKHRRNKTDEQIHALAEKGGVMGLTEYAPICETKPGVRPTIVDYLDQVDYVADLVGVDHVGIGLDLDDTSTPESYSAFKRNFPELCGNYEFETRRVEGLTELAECSQITRGLVARRYSDYEITKILGGNFLRVFERIWNG